MFKNLFLLLTTFLSSLIGGGKEYKQLYVIEKDISPVYIYWIDDINILVSMYDQSFKFNLETKSKDVLSDGLVGYDNGKYIKCEYKNVQIDNSDQCSTFLELKDLDGNLLYNTCIFPTVKPIVIEDGVLIAKSSFSFMQQNYYKVDFKSGTFKILKEKEKEIKKYKGIEDFKQSTISESGEYVVVLDRFNRLVVYRDNRF